MAGSAVRPNQGGTRVWYRIPVRTTGSGTIRTGARALPNPPPNHSANYSGTALKWLPKFSE
eukprot:5490957-Prymnesium_polylepis.1